MVAFVVLNVVLCIAWFNLIMLTRWLLLCATIAGGVYGIVVWVGWWFDNFTVSVCLVAFCLWLLF